MFRKPSVVITIGFIALVYALDRFHLLGFIKDPLTNTLKPLQAQLHSVEQKMAEAFSVVGRISTLNSENRSLELENANLKAENAVLKKLADENKLLRDQLGLRKFEDKLIRAENYGSDPETKELIIRTDEVVEEGLLVVVGNNYIGKIVAHSGYFAKVQLPFDPNAQIPIVTSKGVRGITMGRYRSETVIDKLLIEDDVQEKDIVRTSGEGGYVKDLVLGEISSVKQTEKELFKQVLVRPLVDHAKTDVFFVIKKP